MCGLVRLVERVSMRLPGRRFPLDRYWRASGLTRPEQLDRDDAVDAALAEALLAALSRGDRWPLARVVAVLERELDDPVDPDAVAKTGKFLETVQNACSWEHLPEASSVVPLLGPNTNLVWTAAEEFWRRVAEAIPPTPKGLASVGNEKLRWLLIAGNRQVGLGLYTSLADVLRYEKGSI